MSYLTGPDCRWCGSKTDAEFVDVGVGFVQATGGHCGCGGYEMGPYMTNGRITEAEMASGWRGPDEDFAEFSPFNPDRQETPW